MGKWCMVRLGRSAILLLIVTVAVCAEEAPEYRTLPGNPSIRYRVVDPATIDRGHGVQEVAIITTRHGEIVMRFHPELAPKHVESFKKLARDGFYDGTTFHRVIENFMIQGGDPNSRDADNRSAHGTGGPGYTIPAEFTDVSHKRGIVSAARSSNPDSAGSQFFICVADVPWLDKQYSIFGEVVEGMDVVDRIVAEPRDRNDNPMERVEIRVRIESRDLGN